MIGGIDAEGNNIIHYFTRKELVDAGIDVSNREFWPAELAWQGVLRPSPKVWTTHPSKNRTYEPNTEVQACFSTHDIFRKYEGAKEAFYTPKDGLPFDDDLMDEMLGDMFAAKLTFKRPR
jgi:hypothetical protein